VDRLYKEKVSGVAKSIFCSAIKKYAPSFKYCFQQVVFEGRVVMRFPGYRHDRFVTIVDEEQVPERVVKTRKQAESAKAISGNAPRAPKYVPERPLRAGPVRIECGA